MKSRDQGPLTGESKASPDAGDPQFAFPLLPGSGMKPHRGYTREMRRLPPGTPSLIEIILERRRAHQTREEDGNS